MRPILQESLRIYASSRAYRRAHLLYLGIVSALVLVLWPSAPYIEFFKLSSYPPLYEVAAISVLVLLVAGSMYVGKTSLAREKFVSNSDWLEKTSVPVAMLVAGRGVAGILHGLTLSALAFPFLVVAAGPSGVPIEAVGWTLVVIFVASLATRFCGMWIDAVLERRPILAVLATWAALGLVFVLSIEIFPDMNPIVAITTIAGEPDLSFATFHMTLEPLFMRSVLILALSALFFVGASVVALLIRRRRYASREITL